jgi:hypothetical protein
MSREKNFSIKGGHMKINRGLFSNTIDQDEKRDADVETAISTKEKKDFSCF